jgi:dihydrodipicolinate synthase/N-acetylneuraminate lyase
MLDKSKLFGTWVATITPLGEDNELILESLHVQYTHLQEANINGIIPFSGVGESASLIYQEKVEYLRALGEESGQMKIFPQIGHTSIKEVLKLALVAESAGVDGVTMIPPYFYRPISQETLCEYFTYFFERSKMPIMIYNQEPNTQITLSYPLIEKLSHFENFLGIIDMGKDTLYLHEVKRRFPDLLVFSGCDDNHLEQLNLGCEAIVTELGNVYPTLFSALFDSYQNNDMDKANELQNVINGILDILGQYPAIDALKYTLYLTGFPAMGTRIPAPSLTQDQKTQLKTDIGRYIIKNEILS